MFYSTNLFKIPESDQREPVERFVLSRYGMAMDALKTAFAEPRHDGRLPYTCLGCQVGNGVIRRQAVEITVYPLVNVASLAELKFKTALQAYDAQANEPEADAGPGGVIGFVAVKKNTLQMPDLTAASAHMMTVWVDEATHYSPYMPEEQAEIELWALAGELYPNGIAYLSQMAEVPTTPVYFPAELYDELHALLGVAALRGLVHELLGLKLVLVDGQRLIGEDHLRWEHYFA